MLLRAFRKWETRGRSLRLTRGERSRRRGMMAGGPHAFGLWLSPVQREAMPHRRPFAVASEMAMSKI